MDTTAPLSWSEIEATYPDEWVLLAETEVDEAYAISSGRVVCHGRDRAAMLDALDSTRPRTPALLFTGTEIPVEVEGFLL